MENTRTEYTDEVGIRAAGTKDIRATGAGGTGDTEAGGAGDAYSGTVGAVGSGSAGSTGSGTAGTAPAVLGTMATFADDFRTVDIGTALEGSAQG